MSDEDRASEIHRLAASLKKMGLRCTLKYDHGLGVYSQKCFGLLQFVTYLGPGRWSVSNEERSTSEAVEWLQWRVRVCDLCERESCSLRLDCDEYRERCRAACAFVEAVRIVQEAQLGFLNLGWSDPEQTRYLQRCRKCEGSMTEMHCTGTLVGERVMWARFEVNCSACEGTGRER